MGREEKTHFSNPPTHPIRKKARSTEGDTRPLEKSGDYGIIKAAFEPWLRS